MATSLKVEQLARHLKAAGAAMAPVYIVSGDEPLQLEEACDTIRAAARQQGYTERVVYTVEAGFSWPELLNESGNLSLFASRKLLEVRVPFERTSAGKDVLLHYAKQPPPDTLLLLKTNRIPKAKEKTAWFAAMAARGVHVRIWPVEPAQLPGWIRSRLQGAGLQIEPEALALLSAAVEGNLLAAAQEIERLKLLACDNRVTVETVREAVADHARYTAFDLADAAIAGQAEHSLRIYRTLVAAGTELYPILWALTRELRLANHLAGCLRQGSPLAQAIEQIARAHKQIPFLLKKKQGHYQQFVYRLGERRIRDCLKKAAQAEAQIKGAGVDTGQPATEVLADLVMTMATGTSPGGCAPATPGG